MTNTLSILTIFLIVAIFPSILFSAPLITSKNGNFTEGSNFEISGSGFGGHSLNIEWLGGSSGNIESGTIGNAFVRKGWTVSTTTITNQAPEYSSTLAHSGTKSIKSYWPEAIAECVGAGNPDVCCTGVGVGTCKLGSAYMFDIGSVQTNIFFSFWLYWAMDAGEGGQFKVWRLGNALSYDDNYTLWMSSGIWTAINNYNNYYTYWDSGGTIQGAYEDEATGKILPGQWVRLDIYGQPDTGAKDGVFKYEIHQQSSAVHTIANLTGLSTRTGLRYASFAGYWGNITSGNGTLSKAYVDDVFIQWGNGQARVEICDNGTWANRKHCEIQYPTAWAESSITISVNRGSFVSGDKVYLYVVDANGNVSNNGQGYQIIVGSSFNPPSLPPDTTPPANPQSLRKQ